VDNNTLKISVVRTLAVGIFWALVRQQMPHLQTAKAEHASLRMHPPEAPRARCLGLIRLHLRPYRRLHVVDSVGRHWRKVR